MAFATISISQSGDALVARITAASGYTIEPIVWNWYNAEDVSQTGHVDHGSFTSSFTPDIAGKYYVNCQYNWTSQTGTTSYEATWSGSKEVEYTSGSNFFLYKYFDFNSATGEYKLSGYTEGTITALWNAGAIYFNTGNRMTRIGVKSNGKPYYTYEFFNKKLVTTYPSGTTHETSATVTYDTVVNKWTNWSSWGTGTDLSNLSAYSWNAFTAWVNRVRSKAGIGTYSFTTVSSGDAIAAATVNQARSAIAAIPGHGTLPDAVRAGDPIRGAWFRQLAAAANAAL